MCFNAKTAGVVNGPAWPHLDYSVAAGSRFAFFDLEILSAHYPLHQSGPAQFFFFMSAIFERGWAEP